MGNSLLRDKSVVGVGPFEIEDRDVNAEDLWNIITFINSTTQTK